jgi:DNA-binding GntR family transcriptional regulator
MEPPMLLICLNKTSETREAIASSGRFGVNILGEAQADVAMVFARKSPDKFGAVDIVRGREDIPMIPGALAQLECRVSETATGGTHTVFLGAVEAAAAVDGEPLTYYRGRFGRFSGETHQDATYRRLRELVISRDLARGEPLDVEALAGDYGLDEADVFYALTKLTADGLVARQHDGHLVVRALDVRTAHEAIDARCAIEAAVIDKVAGAIGDRDAATLRAHADAAWAAATARPPDVEALVVAGHAFHAHFIGLLANEAVLSFFLRLDFQAIWRKAGPHMNGRGKTRASYLRELADACIAGDRETAKTVLYEHTENVKETARLAIDALGGEI